MGTKDWNTATSAISADNHQTTENPRANNTQTEPKLLPTFSSPRCIFLAPWSSFRCQRSQGCLPARRSKAFARVWDNNYAILGFFGLRALVIANGDCFVGLILFAHERKPAQSHEKVRNSSCIPPLKSRPDHPFQRHKSNPHLSPCAFSRAILSASSNIKLEICWQLPTVLCDSMLRKTKWSIVVRRVSLI